MTIFQSIIFGIVEGITEFLPISSTAHLDFTRVLFSLSSTEFIKSFEISIQLGAILAVVWLYRKKVFTSLPYFKNIVIAFIPTGVIGFALYKIIKSLLLGNTWLAGVMLLVGGVFILWFEKKHTSPPTPLHLDQTERGEKDAIESLTIRQLLIMGTTQALAVVPGVSRSLSVIFSGRALGLSKSTVTEFSFLLAIPTMLAATVYDLYKSGLAFSGGDWGVLGVGFVVSFIVALLSVEWLLGYIRKHSFQIFGWYRIVIGLVILLIFS